MLKILKQGVAHKTFLQFAHHICEQCLGNILFLISDHDPLHAKQGLLGFLFVPSFLGISSGKWSPVKIIVYQIFSSNMGCIQMTSSKPFLNSFCPLFPWYFLWKVVSCQIIVYQTRNLFLKLGMGNSEIGIEYRTGNDHKIG